MTRPRSAEAADLEYWRRLNPQLTVCGGGRPEAPAGRALAPEEVEAHAEQVRVEGYFRADGCLDAGLVDRLREGILAVRAAGWHQSFAFVYDELWQVARCAAIQALAGRIVGPGYHQRPRVWVYHVEVGLGEGSAGSGKGTRWSGWGPHIDADEPIIAAGGRPKVVSVWVPLTDADPDNGCIYVVPTNLYAGTGMFARYPLPEVVSAADATALLHAARAVPARAGSIVGWHQNVIHWGSFSSPRGRSARISLGMEFQLPGAALTGAARVPFTWAPDAGLPDFRRRLMMIGFLSSMYLGYSEEYLATPERRQLSQELLAMSMAAQRPRGAANAG